MRRADAVNIRPTSHNIIEANAMSDVKYKPLRQMPEYTCWGRMRQRCENPKNKSFRDYGGRGISVCARWQSFENFIADMGKRPSKNHSIERINNDGNYEPSNCRWATRAEQAINKRNNRYLTHNGETRLICEWAEITGIPRKTIITRIDQQNWNIADALTIPNTGRTRTTNNLLTLNGKTRCLTEWSEITGLSMQVIRIRIKRGWSVEKSLTTPAKPYRINP